MRRVLLLLHVSVATSCALVTWGTYSVFPDAPKLKRDSSVQLDGLEQSVAVTYDTQGVPHLEAQTVVDLARAIGFVQARERFFQMDVLRKLARGRLSELVGNQSLGGQSTLAHDKMIRGWNLEHTIEEVTRGLLPGQRRLLDAYAQGVNAAWQQTPSIEHRLLRVSPQPWTAADTVAVGVFTAFQLAQPHHQREIGRLLVFLHRGRAAAQSIDPTESDSSLSTSPLTQSPSAKTTSARAGNGVAFAQPWPEMDFRAYALPGERTQSGKPMLIADLQGSLVVPTLAFQQHLRAPGLDAIGITIPGIPWVLVGRNQTLAWSLAGSMEHALSLHIESNERKGTPCQAATRTETLLVRDGGDWVEHVVRFGSTCRGPLLNDLFPSLFPTDAPKVVATWSHEPLAGFFSSVFALNRATNLDEFAEDASAFPPSMTAIVAEGGGRLSTLGGSRSSRSLIAPSFGARLEHDERLGVLLSATNRLAPSSAQAIFHETASPRAQRLLPTLLAAISPGPDLSAVAKEAFYRLSTWNADASVDSAEAVLFFTVYRSAVLAAGRDEVPSSAWRFLVTQPDFLRIADRWFEQPDHPVWDDRQTETVERRDQILRWAFLSSVSELTEAWGQDLSKWRWGNLRRHQVRHLFGGHQLLAGTVNLPGSEAGGEPSALGAATSEGSTEPPTPFSVTSSSQARLILDLGDPSTNLWSVATGVSGWPGSVHYGDQHDALRKGALAPMHFSSDRIQQNTKGVLRLLPKAP